MRAIFYAVQFVDPYIEISFFNGGDNPTPITSPELWPLIQITTLYKKECAEHGYAYFTSKVGGVAVLKIPQASLGTFVACLPTLMSNIMTSLPAKEAQVSVAIERIEGMHRKKSDTAKRSYHAAIKSYETELCGTGIVSALLFLQNLSLFVTGCIYFWEKHEAMKTAIEQVTANIISFISVSIIPSLHDHHEPINREKINEEQEAAWRQIQWQFSFFPCRKKPAATYVDPMLQWLRDCNARL